MSNDIPLNDGARADVGPVHVGPAHLGPTVDMRLGRNPVPWWVYLITAAAWVVITWVVLRFDVTTVAAVGALAGVVILLAAAAELFNMFTAPGWKWLHGILGAVFLITGIVALFHPGTTFVWVAAFIGWYLLFKGITDIILAFVTKEENEAWWLLLIAGILEMAVGFWAAGNFGRSVYILVLYIAVIAIAHAIGDISTAFRLRRIQHAERAATTATGPLRNSSQTAYNS
jgi:uncharacterized membrane protein HdeD (DUF308 family)